MASTGFTIDERATAATTANARGAHSPATLRFIQTPAWRAVASAAAWPIHESSED
jgi:hypothetical protein